MASVSTRAQRVSSADDERDVNAEDNRPGQLLSVALTVDLLDGGEFHWVIIESFDHSMEFESLAASVIGYETYIEALEAGFEVLRGMSPDPRLGPRDSDEDSGAR